ncbi:MAG: AraC family transcriptional regulator, partial [Bacteroidota bacterium]|nr:AraC family transcriptional regulator [Bacteroidota bacterium]
VIVFDLIDNNYHSLLQNLARQLKVIPENNSIIIPEEIGTGNIKMIQLPNQLQALMMKISFKKDVLIKSGNTSEGDYVLNFDESEIYNPKVSTSAINSFVRLTGSSFKHWEVIKKRSSIQYLKILFSKEWLSNYIGLSEKLSLFEKYIPVKSEAAEKEKLNEDYRKIINEMWCADNDDFLQNIFYNNRILLLIEHFFTRMHAEMLNPKGKYKLSADEVLMLENVERELSTLTASPPDIDTIAKNNFISKARLTQAFKQVYGTSIYNYYQKHRIQKAYELLLTKKFSIREVGQQLGYNNLSNFVLAFKKQFDVTPKSLLE